MPCATILIARSHRNTTHHSKVCIFRPTWLLKRFHQQHLSRLFPHIFTIEGYFHPFSFVFTASIPGTLRRLLPFSPWLGWCHLCCVSSCSFCQADAILGSSTSGGEHGTPLDLYYRVTLLFTSWIVPQESKEDGAVDAMGALLYTLSCLESKGCCQWSYSCPRQRTTAGQPETTSSGGDMATQRRRQPRRTE